MNTTVKKILWPLVMLRRAYDNHLRKTNPEKLFSLYHKRSTGKYLDIDNPKTLDDKIAYMEFRTDTSEWSRLADKVRVREYVEECGYGANLTKLYGVWENAEDVDFSILPNSFVIKTNNGSATNILIKDKQTMDEKSVRDQLNKWLKIDYGFRTAQPHYSHMKPLILAEEFLIDEKTQRAGSILKDFKFYCVNGEPKYVIVYSDRVPNSHRMKRTIYDMDWNMHQEFLGKEAVAGPEIEMPKSFDLMKEMASNLSKPFKFVRVDFYDINDSPIFGEMTFTPGMQETSNEFAELLGKDFTI